MNETLESKLKEAFLNWQKKLKIAESTYMATLMTYSQFHKTAVDLFDEFAEICGDLVYDWNDWKE